MISLTARTPGGFTYKICIASHTILSTENFTFQAFHKPNPQILGVLMNNDILSRLHQQIRPVGAVGVRQR
jgi:hypothetical protein